MRLINVDVLPFLFGKEALLQNHHLIRRDGDGIEFDLRFECVALLLIAVETKHAEIVRPAIHLAQPVTRGGFRNDDQMRTIVVAVLLQVSKQRQRLKSFACSSDEQRAISVRIAFESLGDSAALCFECTDPNPSRLREYH